MAISRINPLAVGPESLVSSAVISQYALIKNSAAGKYATLGTGDDPKYCVGVATTSAIGADQAFFAFRNYGSPVVMISDGNAIIAVGAPLIASPSVAGRVRSGAISDAVVGHNIGAQVAATLNAQVTAVFGAGVGMSSGGGAGTLAALYALGANTADSTLTLDATRGPLALVYAVGVAQTVGLSLQNITAATAANPKYSPAMEFLNKVHDGANSVTSGWLVQSQGIDASTRSKLSFYSNRDGTLSERVSLRTPTDATYDQFGQAASFVEFGAVYATARLVGNSSNYIASNYNVTGWEFRTSNVTSLIANSTAVFPDAVYDDAISLGKSTSRWSQTHSVDYYVGAAGGAGLGSGRGLVSIANAITVPTTDPSGGGVLYAEGGALKYRSAGGTVTTVAPN